MGRIVVHEFIALDGVFEDPSWTADWWPWDPRMEEAVGALTASASDILLGRRTYEMFAPAWSARTAEEDPGAPFFNETPKHVVTSGPLTVEWNNSTALGTYSAEAIRDLKARTEGSIYISGSGQLVRALLADGLIDELHLFVYPIAIGKGARLWGEGADSTKLSLLASEAYSNGVVHLAYGPLGEV
ncbi:dihydrofolate reductase family protein [Sinomonas halotolerans]|uniref:Dihydrofolate reductase family protein n=1 Tax=Sinomonas halotolerans TaxID=1644133 RepID=A0ABU9WXK8_9MICC